MSSTLHQLLLSDPVRSLHQTRDLQKLLIYTVCNVDIRDSKPRCKTVPRPLSCRSSLTSDLFNSSLTLTFLFRFLLRNKSNWNSIGIFPSLPLSPHLSGVVEAWTVTVSVICCSPPLSLPSGLQVRQAGWGHFFAEAGVRGLGSWGIY